MILFFAAPRSAKGQGEGEKHVRSAPAEEQPSSPAAAPDTETLLLRQELAEQKAALAALRADLDEKLAEEQVKRDAAVAQAKDEAVNAAVDKAVTENKKSSPWLTGLSLGGFAQTDFAIRQSSTGQLNTSTGEPLNQNRFVLRRLRLATSLDRGYTAGVFELDANSVNGAQVRPVHFEATLRLPPESGTTSLLALTVGLFKIPFGHEVLQSDRERLLLERSAVIQEFFPGEYDLGARLAGGWRFVRYAVAVQNGEPAGEKTFPLRDPNSAKDISGRLGIDAPLTEHASVAAGFSALTGTGFHKGLAPTKSGMTYNDRDENNSVGPGEITAVAAKAAIPSQNFSRNAMGVDARFTLRTDALGTSMLYGEVVWAKNLGRGSRLFADPVAMGRDVLGFGYNLALVQDIYTHVQVGIRYDHYDPDRDTTDLQAAKTVPSSLAYDTWAFAGAVRTVGARLVAEFDLNRNHNGRNSAGMPTNLADNAFTLRAEVSF
jgi:hypothetical protein